MVEWLWSQKDLRVTHGLTVISFTAFCVFVSLYVKQHQSDFQRIIILRIMFRT